MTRRPRTLRVPVRLPPPSATGQWLRSIRLSGFTIASLVLVVLFIVVLAPSLRIMIEQQQQLAQLHDSVAEQKQKVKDLSGERARWDDPSYVDAQARERLNFVYPGEYSYLVIDDTSIPTTGNGQPISAEIQTTQVDWVSSLLSSVLTAGLTDAVPGQIVAPAITGSK